MRIVHRGVGNIALVAMACIALAGCQRAAEPQFVSSPAASRLEPELQQQVREQLRRLCGTPSHPKLLGVDQQDDRRLARGAAVYGEYCVQCHGVSGDGAGLAAAYLTPRPRDYRNGIFKFTSTPYGFKPRREDLLRTVERGVTGTSMPSFERLPKRDREDVVDYVLALTHRGELERLLAAYAESEGEVDEETADMLAESVIEQWHAAAENVVDPETKMPPISEESIAAGAEIFQKRECYKCHGRDGRGGLAGGIEVGNDAWGNKAPAADLTSGMLHGGQQPVDVYRRIASGINGTPMPAFKDSFASEPDSIWNLTHYVLSLADEPRRGKQFLAEAPAAVPADQAPSVENTP